MTKATRTQIAGIIADETLSGTFGARQVASLAAYLVEERRTNELNSLLRDVSAVWADKGVVEVIAGSAHDLTPDIRRNVEAEVRRVYPNAQRIIVTHRLDPAVVGGIILSFTGHRLDLSVAGKLKKFKALAVHGKD